MWKLNTLNEFHLRFEARKRESESLGGEVSTVRKPKGARDSPKVIRKELVIQKGQSQEKILKRYKVVG